MTHIQAAYMMRAAFEERQPPCDEGIMGCKYREKCQTEKKACGLFMKYVDPTKGNNYKHPSKAYYILIFPGDK